MATPAKLVYTDDTGTEQTIGVFRPNNLDNSGIGSVTIEEDARAYKRVVIEGGPDLQENMPVLNSEFEDSEPEIFLEIDENNDGNFTRRLRVFPEGGGSTLDNGRYKHENLWGFKKQLGGERVNIGPITGTIEDVVRNTLPNGYTVQYPSDETPPDVYGFTANDARQQIWTDIQEDFNHIVEFTSETDGNDDFIVRLQPLGYGGVQFTLERGFDSINYDYWKPNDTSQIVSEVRVVGTTSDDTEINITRTPADFSGLSSAERERFKPVKAGYLGGTETEAESMAEEIAKRNLNPLPSDNGALETTLDPNSNINDTIGLVDNERNTDDNYTVVYQKDWLHEGLSYYSLEFESEETRKTRRKWREHDNERANIYPSQTEDVGSQNVNANTETVTDSYDDHNSQQHPHDVGGKQSTQAGGATSVATASSSNTVSGSDSTWNTGVTFTPGNTDTQGANVHITWRNTSTNADALEIRVRNQATGDTYPRDNGAYAELSQNPSTTNIFAQRTISIPENTADNTYEVQFRTVNANQSETDWFNTAQIVTYNQHAHDILFEADRAQNRADFSDNNVQDNDSTAGDTSSLNATGSTDEKNVNITSENKTDR